MADPTLAKSLVLQGGGALGAYELGVARVLYGQRGYRPDLVAGVSIGAITSVLLARPKCGDPLTALEGFWKRVTVAAPWLPDKLEPYASLWGNPNFFMPRGDVWNLPHWTHVYSTVPLRRTLAEFVDEAALADPEAMPRLIMTATDVVEGQIAPFWSGDGGLTLDHVLASGSLPPSFPATTIDGKHYWDGGLFDNTPLGEVIARMKPNKAPPAEREVVVVNLFPNAGTLPTTYAEVRQRMMTLSFANKTASDIQLLMSFNRLALLMREIRTNDDWKALRELPAYKDLDRGYLEVPNIVDITRTGSLDGAPWSDFSPHGIERLAKAGEEAALEALAEADRKKKAVAKAKPEPVPAE
ncbi:patatin-like phospholipase family protein [Phenylobacterium sp. LjRoot225]|uniref:patatin-like phospholipase family protein n=1 Tax=Phenylobacterium sp. LjRoot225 TaxID=3342285 RepID=UPI003ECD213D